MLYMNEDGYVDLLSGSYWFENPGAKAAATGSSTGSAPWASFVSDCGEWIVDVDHDGQPDLVAARWVSNGLIWFPNPGP